MADYEFYPIGVSSEDAREAIVAAAAMAKTAGILRGTGTGGVTMAEAGTDYGYPVLQGNGPPTMFVVGAIGQMYYNLAASSAPYLYVCTDFTAQGYQWQVLGRSGDGFTILGYYSSVELMQSSVVDPHPGDAYGVGTAAPYTIYVYDGLMHTWKNNGTLGVGGVASGGVPPHGSTGQLLAKRSDATGDTEWVNPSDIAAGITITAFETTLYANTWQPSGGAYLYTKNLTASEFAGFVGDGTCLADLLPSADWATAEAQLEAYGLIYKIESTEAQIRFYASDRPAADITIKIREMR